jgi:CRP-like cAMP-binding protein
MNTLREARQEYLVLRRGLGYKMRDAGLLLPRFVRFLEKRRAQYITTRLALEWVQQAKTVQIVRDHDVMLLLGSMRAEERVTALLLNLSQRYFARGYSPSEFRLRMTREEIGSYLGLKLETVSRVFSKLQEDGLIRIQNKSVQLKDVRELQRLMGSGERQTPLWLKHENVFYVSF